MTEDQARRSWPNNRPSFVTLKNMKRKGWKLECVGPKVALGYREAWFINAAGIHEMHLISNDENTETP